MLNSRKLRVSAFFSPLRLTARKKNYVDLVVKIKNLSEEKQLVSFDAVLPSKVDVAFDETGLNKAVEQKVGWIEPGEEKEVSVRLWGSVTTSPCECPVELHVFSHYLNYNKVLGRLSKRIVLRVV